MPFVIETTPLKKVYASAATGGLRRETHGSEFAVAFPSLRIARGGLVALRGVSGVGKSTLLNLLAGLDRAEPIAPGEPCSIRLSFAGPGGEEVTDIAAGPHLVPRDRVGFMFQQGHLLPNVPVGVNIALPGVVHAEKLVRRGHVPLGQEAVGTLMRQLNLEPEQHYHKRAWQLSGGQAQRVAFARAIAHGPELVFADEPTSSLDEENATHVITWLRRWLAEDERRTVVWVTHQRALSEAMADSILDLERFSEQDFQNRVLEPRPNRMRRPIEPLAETVPASDSRPGRTQTRDLAASMATTLALSEVFSHRSALADESRQAPLSRWLSQVPGPSSQRPGIIGLSRAMVAAYADWQATLILILSSLLLFIAIAGGLANWRLAEQALVDPLSCRIEVSRREGLTQRYFPRETAEELATRPWSTASADSKALQPPKAFDIAPADCRKGPGAFGSLIEVTWGIGAIIDGVCQTERVSARILVTPRNDPMFRKVQMLAADGSPTKRTMYDHAFDESRFSDKEIYLTLDRYEALRDGLARRLGPAVKIERICLSERGGDALSAATRFPFELAGIIDDIPTIGVRRAGAFVPDEVYQRWQVSLGGSTRPWDKAQLYFNPFDYANIDAYLRSETSQGHTFHFSVEDLKRVKSRVLLHILALASIVCLCLMLGTIFASYLQSWLDYYLATNAKPLSVVSAFGVSAGFLFRLIIVRGFVNLMVGIAVIIGLLGMVITSWLVAIQLQQRGYLSWLPIDPETVGVLIEQTRPAELMLAALATFIIVAVLISLLARRAVNIWVRSNRYVAANIA